jgi:small-conductance mechanosensitive channel
LGLLGTRLITGRLDRRLLPLTALDPGVRNSMTTVLGYIGFAVATVIALAQLGVNPQNLTVVAGALSVGIGFGLQAITANFISGLIVLAERPIRVGDTVTVKGEQGKVKKISVRSTTIAGVGTDIIVPNTDILTSVVTNKSLSDWLPRLKVAFALAQDADQDKAAGIMLDCARANPNVLDDPEPLALFLKAGERGLEFELRCAIDDADPDHADAVRSALNFAIIRDFRQHGITLAGAWPAEPGAPAKMAPARPRVATPVVEGFRTRSSASMVSTSVSIPASSTGQAKIRRPGALKTRRAP